MADLGGKCLLARARLAQFTSSLKESGTAQKAGTLVKVGYLGSLKTTERNVLGNLTFGGVEYLASRPLAVATDYLQAAMRSAATFGRVKPHEFRQIANTLNRGGLERGEYGIRKGIHQAVELMRTGVDAEGVQEKFDLGETTFKNSTLDKVTKFVFNSLEAQDKPFYGFAFQTSLYGRARLMAIREGLSGKALTPRINELLEAPTEGMVLGAHADAQYATFKNETALSSAASALRQGVKGKLARAEPGKKLGLAAASLAMDITIPFTKVASAIAYAGVDYSPAGFAKALIEAAANKNPRIEAQLQQQLARATLGTGLTMIGYSMYHNGTMTGSAPTDPGQRKLWDAENKQANSVLINGRWRSITFLGPLAIPMLLGANIRRFQGSDEEKGAGETAAFALGSIGKTMTEQSYLQGVSNLIGALSETDKRASSMVAGLIPIPSLVGQVASAVDPVSREAHSAGERIQARIPFASKRLPERIDPFGLPVMRSAGGIRGAVESLADPTNPRTDVSDDLTKELERLQVSVSGVGSSFTVKGQKIQRTPETIRALTKEIGPQFRTRLENLIRSEKYLTADDDERERLLRKAMDDVKKPVYKREREAQSAPSLADRIQMLSQGQR